MKFARALTVQPGLEVAAVWDNSMFPVTPDPIARNEPLYLQSEDYHERSASEKEVGERRRPWWRRRRWIFLCIAIVCVAVIGVGVGVGVAKKTSSGNKTPTGSTTSNKPDASSLSDSTSESNEKKTLGEGAALAAVPSLPDGEDKMFYQAATGEIMLASRNDSSGWSSERASGRDEVLDLGGRTARSNTPLASVSWDNGREMRLMYITSENAVAVHAYKDGAWEKGKQMYYDAHDDSQIAATLFNSSSQLRMYYQNPDKTLREVTYYIDNDEWDTKGSKLPNATAAAGSGLAVTHFKISDQDFETMTLYYVDANNRIREMQYNYMNRPWEPTNSHIDDGTIGPNGSYKVKKGSPLTAVGFTYLDNDTADVLLFGYTDSDSSGTFTQFWCKENQWEEPRMNLPAPKLLDGARLSAYMSSASNITVIGGVKDNAVGRYDFDITKLPDWISPNSVISVG